MTINQKLFDLFPNTLDENQFSALLKLISMIDSKGDVIKIEESEFADLFKYGRDRTDQVLSFLVDKKYITREQKRDESGKFTYNEIKIITNLVK
jgi:CTP-dependent riboflavin kinase